MEDKDYIGQEWKCPVVDCKYKTKVTADGIYHIGSGHMIIHSLAQYAAQEEWSKKKFEEFMLKVKETKKTKDNG